MEERPGPEHLLIVSQHYMGKMGAPCDDVVNSPANSSSLSA
jgi:hypothetical protein